LSKNGTASAEGRTSSELINNTQSNKFDGIINMTKRLFGGNKNPKETQEEKERMMLGDYDRSTVKSPKYN
jgi:hypothetical protein